ncbi:SURF1 family cytochrome oxidase biogenesis protein [Sphingomonas xanthus]|uniref:SURF1-like protein n=1 Tax=Sphingomonas xanthus TaxID=2594473 RepID=A0A516IS46_9SPHN|nr:SURF1 family cytochrome oxidase biogenesis protein [Sphingomonas xanthus]QDP19701.1 SURF1 family protein [Sphingomonas xanthus]
MIRKLPLIPTILVAGAIAVMIALGFWQLQRKTEKDALVAAYAAAADKAPIGWPSMPLKEPLPLFRYATGNCLAVTAFRTAAGQNRRGEPGYLVIADCRTGAEGPGMAVELGWSKNPNAGREFKGGLVSGLIAPDRVSRMRIVAASPGPGLEASALPSPETIPNNHLSYAIQWFLFAGIAGIIYALALRQRWRKEAGNG